MATGERGRVSNQIHRLFASGTVGGMSDRQLLERFTAGRDEDAFAALVGRHGPMVFGICRSILGDRHSAEDAFQATFLVLIRKAGSVWVGDSLGGWLHRVAYHAALKARAAEARRRVEERRAGETVAQRSEAFEASDELGPLLHAEIDRLPERFRLPVVLCDVEGLSRDEAAAQLRWSEGTLRGRLARARHLLRARLTRRGIAISTGTLALTMSQAASAALPETRRRAALALVAGSGTPAAVSLATALLRGRLVVRILGAAVLTIAAAGLVLAANLPADHPAEPSAPPPAERPLLAPAAEAESNESVEVQGRVLDPSGRPFAGAKLVFYDPTLERKSDGSLSTIPTPTRAISGPDGRFRFRADDVGFRYLQDQATAFHPTVAAFAHGYGPDWVSFATPARAKDLTLRLVVDDVPIEGRILNLEAQPVAGVTVSITRLQTSTGGNLDAWEREVARAKDVRNEAWRFASKGLDARYWLDRPTAVSGADGRFRLTGIGHERLVTLSILGPNIVASVGREYARTRNGPTYRFPMYRNESAYGTLAYHGAKFDHVAAPTRPIIGVVRDKESGRPLPGVLIQSDRFAGNPISRENYVRTTTDADGRFRLLGMPAGAGNVIEAVPALGQPFLGAEAEVPAGRPVEPAVVDFALKRSVMIAGRVTDKITGAPVTAIVRYSYAADNPNTRGVMGPTVPEQFTDEDGTFAIVGLPGRGLLSVRASRDRYLTSQGYEAVSKLRRMPFDRDRYHAFVEVNPEAGIESLRCDVTLDPGKTLRGTVLAPDGQPLEGVSVSGLNPATWRPSNVTLTSSGFTAEALDPKRPRPIFFMHRSRHLAGYIVLKGDEAEPLSVRLQPSAFLTGRLLDLDGIPLHDVTISCRIDPDPFGVSHVPAFFDRSTVDEQGRMRIEGLIPGLVYTFDRLEGNRLTGKIAERVILAPGEARDLGELRLVPTSGFKSFK